MRRPWQQPRRRMLDAIFHLVRGGLAWRQLPAEFPPRPSTGCSVVGGRRRVGPHP
ncbi:transposase [Geodermatophilus sp. URMC 60]